MSEVIKSRGLTGLVTRLMHGLERPAPLPEKKKPALRVTTHVARDLLQNAAYFNNVPKVALEYVTNAIDNGNPGKPVSCQVTLSPAEIRIADNANGMSYTELFDFFQMHGVNVQRRRGRIVRGKFGTGKSAAFGIADTLQIETVKEGNRNIVELRRVDVEAAKDGQPIPVREILVNEKTRLPSGTTIAIKNINVKIIDANAVRTHLEKTMGRYLALHKIAVNGVGCQYSEPAAIKTFRFKAPRQTRKQLGAATCVLKICKEPLRREENVVAILCHGFLHATTLAGKQAEPFVEYIFGEVEVPGLDLESERIPAFDNTRNLSLNPQNSRVQALLSWLAECIEKVRQELVARDKRRRYSKEMRLLRNVAAEIQNFLNEDFRVLQEKLPWATMPGSRRRRKIKRGLSRHGQNKPTLAERGRVLINRLLRRSDEANGLAHALESLQRGGRVQFEINYVRLGSGGPRARYLTNRRTIYLNRDHPQLYIAEAEAGIASLTFKMLSFDIAFTEYALAVVLQLADQGIEVADPIDAGEMVQTILDRLGRKAAEYFHREAEFKTEALQPVPIKAARGNGENGKDEEKISATYLDSNGQQGKRIENPA